jgi:2-desacetyl-2-hydroxyethyl bacteriochlorophyllide A dehydrogenase
LAILLDVRALLYRPDFSFEIVEAPAPSPAPGEVVVEVEAAGICGSDVQGVATRSPRRAPPLVMGHELSGTVVEVGAGIAPTLVGKRVAVNPQVPCGACLLCRSGRENVCADRELIGGTRPGGFADRVAVPAGCVHVLSDVLPREAAVLAEPLATCVHGFRLVESAAVLPSTVIVLGAGPIGLLAAQVARHAGVHGLVVSETEAERREWAAGVADAVHAPSELEDAVAEMTDGRGADVVVDAVGSDRTRADSLRLLARAGIALWLGMHDQEATIPAFDAVVKEQRIQGSFAYTNADFARAVELLEHDAAAFSLPVSSSSLDEGARIFELLLEGRSEGMLKAVLAP